LTNSRRRGSWTHQDPSGGPHVISPTGGSQCVHPINQATRIELGFDGFNVVTAANGVEALALFDALHFDVVVTDIFMPEEDGIELIQDVRAREPRFPIVAISGGSLRHLKALGIASSLGADALLEKPCDAGELVAAIRRAIDAAR
jgi:CheY-like chemotaxis protein